MIPMIPVPQAECPGAATHDRAAAGGGGGVVQTAAAAPGGRGPETQDDGPGGQ